MDDRADVIVVGSGPNGLAAACALARSGWDVTVLERAGEPGGAVRCGELTLPGYVHDLYSSFYGLLHASPAFGEFELGRRVEWAHFETPVAAAVEPGVAALCHADLEWTVDHLNSLRPGDGDAWRDLYSWWQRIGRRFLDAMLAPVGAPLPALKLLAAARIRGTLDLATALLEPPETLTRRLFTSPEARALFASGASHTDLAIDVPGGSAFVLLLAMLAQERNMPVAVGGARRITAALVDALAEAGGQVLTGHEVRRIAVERGRAAGVETSEGGVFHARRAVVADVGPPQLVELVGEARLPARYLDGIRRWRYGTGMFRADLALDGPVPWKAPGLGACGVVHVTGDLETMARTGYEVRRGLLPVHPMLVVGQHTVADPSRAPKGRHTLWIETMVPGTPRADAAGSVPCASWAAAAGGFFERSMALLERHAPGLGSRVLAHRIRTPADLHEENPNLVDGDPGGGSSAIDQQFVLRPVPGWFRYATPVRGLYLCSASTHPGGGVHGMCGWNAARRVLRDATLLGRLLPLP
ncbi:MAG TPA: NAD(P)/FAD-dependent oxidoreductase [Actinomycetota bacterium]